MSTAKDNSPALIAYNVTESNKKTDWMRIGAAWPNKKGGFQVKLETVPDNGEIVLLPPPKAKQDRRPAGGRAGGNGSGSGSCPSSFTQGGGAIVPPFSLLPHQRSGWILFVLTNAAQASKVGSGRARIEASVLLFLKAPAS